MDQFPDEARLPRSEVSNEPIRGGSIGLNRILGNFVTQSVEDKKPRYHAVLLSAMTIFRNVWNTQISNKVKPTLSSMEEGFVTDIQLFSDYFDTYLSYTWSRLASDHFVPVVIYFPDYHKLPKELVKPPTGKALEMEQLWKSFLKKHDPNDSEVKRLTHSRCVMISAGRVTYPHKEVVQKFKDIVYHSKSLYHTGDPICLISHIPLDLYIAQRLRGIQILESFTAATRNPTEFKLRLDKEGRIPFQSAPHAVLGDGVQIGSMVGRKVRQMIFEQAEKDRWITRGEDDVRSRLAKILDKSPADLRKYDFV